MVTPPSMIVPSPFTEFDDLDRRDQLVLSKHSEEGRVVIGDRPQLRALGDPESHAPGTELDEVAERHAGRVLH